MRAGILVFAAAVVLALTPAVAQELPRVVEQHLQTLVKDCDGKMEIARKSLQTIDLNEDGIPDFVIDTEKLGCEMASYYCGSAGCTLMIFASHGGTHAIAWEGNVHQWKPIKLRGKPGLHFDLHGSACNKVGSAACRKRFVFDGARLRPVK